MRKVKLTRARQERFLEALADTGSVINAVAVAGTSRTRVYELRKLDPEFAAAWAQADTRRVLGVVGADVIGRELPVGQAEDAFTADGGLLDPEQQAALTELVEVLAARVVAEEAQSVAVVTSDATM